MRSMYPPFRRIVPAVFSQVHPSLRQRIRAILSVANRAPTPQSVERVYCHLARVRFGLAWAL